MKIVDQFIPDSFKTNSADYSKAKLLTLIGYIATFLSLVTFLAYAAIGFYDGIIIIILPTLSSILYLSLIRYSGNLVLCANYLVVSFLTLVTLFVVFSNGIYSPYLIWMVAVPVAAYLLSGKKMGDIIISAILLIFLGLAGLKYFKIEVPELILGDWLRRWLPLILI